MADLRAAAQQAQPESRCANCGKPASEATAVLSEYPEEGEWFCSSECKDQHDELGCPHEHHDGYRHPKEAARLIAAECALRSLASWLGAGGFNAPEVDAKVFEEKIRWGVDHMLEVHKLVKPQPVAWRVRPLTERELELLDGMIEVQLHHAAQCDLMLARAGGNHTMAARQKGWDMERVELLRKIKRMVAR